MTRNVSIAMVRKIQAPIRAVYTAWTEPRLIAKWLAPGGDAITSVTTDLRRGGRYRIEGQHAEGRAYSISGTYLELSPDQRIAMSWAYDGPVASLKGNASTLIAEFRALDANSTELTLTHEKHQDREAAEITRVSWNSCITKLEGVAEAECRDADLEAPRDFFTEGQREIQDRRNTRQLADRLEAILVHDKLGAADAAFIARQNMFFFATSDIYGQPNCSYKGGKRGFVSVVDDNTIAFPDYDGNGMNLSLGNIHETGKVGLLFIDFERQARIRILGRASVVEDDPLVAQYPGAQAVVRVTVESVFSNCPRYVHKMKLIEESVFVPVEEVQTPAPGWKKLNAVADVLAEEDKHLAGTDTDLKKTLNRD
jgi:uncharacterized protein